MMELQEAKKQEPVAPAYEGPPVVFVGCKLHKNTLDYHDKNTPNVISEFGEFVKSKRADPLKPYKSKDTSFNSKAPLGSAIPGLRHAHLTRDHSVFYTLSGAAPRKVHLYGIFSHQDSGTGDPANINRQKDLAKKLKTQDFDTPT